MDSARPMDCRAEGYCRAQFRLSWANDPGMMEKIWTEATH